jgi:hypothetical protein
MKNAIRYNIRRGNDGLLYYSYLLYREDSIFCSMETNQFFVKDVEDMITKNGYELIGSF